MWKGLVHIRESVNNLGKGKLLYNVIAVYLITVQIKTSAKFVSHYNLLAVFCYPDHFFSASLKIQLLTLKQLVDQIACSYLQCSELFKDMECTLLPTIGKYYYICYTNLFLYVENLLLFTGTLTITTRFNYYGYFSFI